MQNPTMLSRQQISRVICMVLGSLFLVAGILKGIDLDQFARQIGQYAIFPDNALILIAVARTLVVCEMMLAAALLVNWHPRMTIPATITMLLLFSVALTHGMLQGTLTDCGCFGPAARRSPGSALFEDALMLAAAVVAWQLREEPIHYCHSAKSWIVTAAAVTGFGISFVPMANILIHPSSQSTHNPSPAVVLTTPSGEAITFSAGNTLLALISTECIHCREAVPMLNQIAAEQESVLHVTAVSANPTPDVQRFIEENFTFYPVLAVDETSLARVMTDDPLPQYLLIRNGRIIARWQHVPEAQIISNLVGDTQHG